MQSVIEMLGERAALHPERAALLCGEQRVSYGQLWAGVTAAAACLAERGVRAGDRVMFDAPSVPAFVHGYFAAHFLGAVAMPFDPRAPVARRAELAERTRPRLAVVADAQALAEVPCRSMPLGELESAPAQRRELFPPAPETLADLIFTTGTTGRPKGVRLTHRNLAAAVRHINAVTGTSEADVDIIPIPLYHAFGLGSLRSFLSAGATVVLVQGFRLPGEIFGALERHSATGLIGVPAGFAILLRFGEEGLGAHRDRLRYVEVGSAPMPIEQKRQLTKLLPKTRLFMHYGLTEAGRSAYSEFHRDHARLDSIGLPSPGVSIQARDEDGLECRPGVRGILWVSGRHVSPGYWDDPELSAATFAEGWMRTGDVGHVDASGYIYLHSRSDDMINVAGVKVAPDEVERVLAEHPDVADAACVGVPDPRGISGQVVRAYLVAAEGRSPCADAELTAFVGRRLEHYKVPGQYVWVAELPRTASGKLQRATLRRQVAA